MPEARRLSPSAFGPRLPLTSCFSNLSTSRTGRDSSCGSGASNISPFSSLRPYCCVDLYIYRNSGSSGRYIIIDSKWLYVRACERWHRSASRFAVPGVRHVYGGFANGLCIIADLSWYMRPVSSILIEYVKPPLFYFQWSVYTKKVWLIL